MVHASKFKKWDIVEYTKSRKEEIIQNINGLISQGYSRNELGEIPIKKLIIDEDPGWNNYTKTWVYSYSYGQCMANFGSTSEQCLKHCE